MTNEEAIRIIKTAIAEVEWEYPMEYAVAFEEAIAALEKQIPKKPKNVRNDCDGMKAFDCPCCGEFSGYYAVLPARTSKYCGCCGQAIDWGDTE